MRLPSFLLSSFAANNKEGTIVDEGDVPLVVPGVLQPHIVLPIQIGKAAGFSVTTNETQSRISNAFLGQPASSVANTSTLITLKRGLWFVTIAATFCASWTQALDNTVAPAGQVQLLDDASSIMTLMYFNAINLSTENLLWSAWLNIPADGWLIRLSVAATGVGQTHQLAASVYAARLH